MPFLAEKVTKAWVLKWLLYPLRNPLFGSRVSTSILLISATSVRASPILRLAVSRTL